VPILHIADHGPADTLTIAADWLLAPSLADHADAEPPSSWRSVPTRPAAMLMDHQHRSPTR